MQKITTETDEQKDLRNIVRDFSALFGRAGIQTEVDIEVAESWQKDIETVVDGFKYIIHCRPGAGNYKGVALSFRAFHPRREGDCVKMYGENWIVEHCEVSQDD